MTTPLQRRDTSLPSFDEPNAPATALEGALAFTRSDDSTVPHQVLQHEAAKPIRARAEAAQHRTDQAVATVVEAVGHFFVGETETSAALAALASLRPEEFERALHRLDAEGALATLINALSPEQLAQLTKQLKRAGAFDWAESTTSDGTPGPAMVNVKAGQPDCVAALAHDLNLAIAQRHGARGLREPGTGEVLYPEDRQRFQWQSGPVATFEHVAGSVGAVMSVELAVQRLEVGDSYSLKRDTSVGLTTIGPTGAPEASVARGLKTGLDVVRRADGYGVSFDAGVMDKASLTFVQTALGSASTGAGLSASDLSSMRVELRFAKRDDAVAVATALAHTGVLPTPELLAVGSQLRAARTVTLDNLAAVELSRTAAANLGLKFGVGPFTAGLDGGDSAKLSTRVEFKAGVPSAVVTKASLRADERLGAAIAHKLSNGPKSSVGSARSLDERTVRVDLEKRVALAKGQSFADAVSAWSAAPAALTVGLESKAGFADGTNVKELKTQVSADTVDGLAGAVTRGAEALREQLTALPAPKLTSKRVTSSSAGLSLSAKVPLEGFALKGDLGFEAKRAHVSLQRDDSAAGLDAFFGSL